MAPARWRRCIRATGEGDVRIDPAAMMRIAAGFDKGAHGIRQLGLAQQNAVHAAAEDLAELPGVEADIGGVGAVDRRLDDDGRRAVARARRSALDEAAHVLGQARHVEGAVLHADIDVVGPGMRVLAALRVGQHVAAMAADVVDRLVCSSSSRARLIRLATTASVT